MPVAFDAALVAALARELDARLDDARLRAVRLDRPARALSLIFREGTLRFALHPEAGSVGWHEPVEPEPNDRPLAARVKRVRALTDDRVLRISVLKARGAPAAIDVIVEWITGRWNASVVEGGIEDGEGIVRHVLIEMEGERAQRVGYPWTPPMPSDREGADGQVALGRWMEVLSPLAGSERRRALLSTFAWTSPLNADAILRAGAGDENALVAGHALWTQVAEVSVGRRDASPVLVTTERSVQPYPTPLGTSDEAPSPSLLDAFASAATGTTAPAIPESLLDGLRERAVRAWARVESLRRELAEAPDPVAVRAIGDLILARIADVPRGRDRATLTGFDELPVEVELDAKLSPNENAAGYYEKAGRAERARDRIPQLIAKAEQEARRVDGLVEAAQRGELSADAIRAELPAVADESTRDIAPALPYRIYRSSGGLEIRVGRGAKHNDELTFHHSSPNDVWLHARHAAGAHVVLRWNAEGNPPARDLAEAAVLAAVASKARSSGTVPVDWTRRKYVRKPRRSPPGQVLVERAKTVFVQPDPALEERLRES